MSMATIAKSEHLSPRDLQKCIKHAHDKVKSFIASRGNDHLRSLWPQWDVKFRSIFEATKQRPEVAISLVGGTGAGKSTLLNALIGARVLPVSNMRACTAAICEVGFSEGPYRARIEFVSRQNWEHEVELLLADLRDAQQASNEDNSSDAPVHMSKAVREKLWTVYRPAEDSPQKQFDPLKMVEPPEIKEALDVGYTEVSSPHLKEFRKQIESFLHSQHRFWPIVKTVAIHGDFAALRDGAKIIDLPGINDPNEAREEVTKKHLKTCRFVWLVFNIKRALTRDTINLMQSDDFLRQVVMDGRADALTFVATAADDVDLETGIEEFKLNDGATITEVVAARNNAARDVVLSQLDDLASRLGEMAHEQRDTANKLATRFKASKIFSVSAREYLRLTGLANTNSAGFDDPSQTELPALIDHMREICAAYGVSAHCESLNNQLQMLFTEITREIRSRQNALALQAEVNERGRKEMEAAVESAQTFLDRDLAATKEHLVQALDADQSVLVEKVKRAVDRARHDLEVTVYGWQGMHWATIRAVCRRGGKYRGSTGTNDFPADISKPILDGIAFAWSDFFGERLSLTLEKWTDRLLRNASAYRTRLGNSLAKSSGISQSVMDGLDGILETTERILSEILAQTRGQMESKIQDDQRTLYESVPLQIRANMQSAFEDAGLESGSGMKQRMISTLAEHANRVAQTMFDEARDAILDGVRGLNDWISREFEKMIDVVRNNAGLAAENLLCGDQNMTHQAVADEQAVLSDLFEVMGNFVVVAK